jgi:hypothetical protein
MAFMYCWPLKCARRAKEATIVDQSLAPQKRQAPIITIGIFPTIIITTESNHGSD